MSRLLRIFFYAAALAALIWYGRANNPNLTLAMCLADPEKYHGRRIEVANETVVQQVYSDSFTVRYLDRSVTVIGDARDVRSGDFLSLIAVFDRSGRLLLEKKHIALYRRWKIWVSIPPVLLFIWLFIRRYSFEWRTWQWREADHA
jgi:hypothetical protein